MRRMTSNRLLVGALALVVGYWLVGALPIWSGYMNATVSGLLLIAGALVMASWGKDAYQVVKSGVVEGPQLALIGVTTIAAGSVYSGAFGLLWAIAGEPMEWLGTPYSAFGRYTMAIGFVLQFLSPEATAERFRPPRWYYIAGAVVLIAMMSFALGTRWGDARTADSAHRIADLRQSWLASCAVIGNPRTMRYHTMASPYRGQLSMYDQSGEEKPCFASEEEARAAGYRAPG